jgi:HIT domain
MPEAPTDQLPASATCAFCRIIRGEEQASVVFEDDLSLAFLDHRPLFPGHCLLVRKRALGDAGRSSRSPGRPPVPERATA